MKVRNFLIVLSGCKSTNIENESEFQKAVLYWRVISYMVLMDCASALNHRPPCLPPAVLSLFQNPGNPTPTPLPATYPPANPHPTTLSAPAPLKPLHQTTCQPCLHRKPAPQATLSQTPTPTALSATHHTTSHSTPYHTLQTHTLPTP